MKATTAGRLPLVGNHFYRENPGPPDRPEREGGGSGGNRWFFATLGVFVLLLVLGRLVGPAGTALVWALGLAAFYLFRRRRP